MNEVLLTTESLTKEYRIAGGPPIAVLKSVNFEIRHSDRIAILGRSGAGKSTLLHILGTLEAPTRGKVRFKNKDVFSLDEGALSAFRNRQLGFVFQLHYLMLEFSALENVMMPCLLANLSKKESKDRAMKLLGRVGLQDRANHKPSQLSGGEQSRVAIARALVMRPTLLLTDEMTGNLDAATGRQIFELMGELHTEYEMAIVSVTHDEQLARSYPRVYRLDAGDLNVA